MPRVVDYSLKWAGKYTTKAAARAAARVSWRRREVFLLFVRSRYLVFALPVRRHRPLARLGAGRSFLSHFVLRASGAMVLDP